MNLHKLSMWGYSAIATASLAFACGPAWAQHKGGGGGHEHVSPFLRFAVKPHESSNPRGLSQRAARSPSSTSGTNRRCDRLACLPDTKLGFSLLGKTRHGVQIALIATRYRGAQFFC